MRKLNSSFKTEFISENGIDSVPRTYFAYVPLEDMVCYAVAECYDGDDDINSAKLAVESVLTSFERNPSFRNIKQYIRYAHDQIKAHSVKNKLEAAIAVAVSDYTRIRYASCGNIQFYILSDNAIYYRGETQTYYRFASREYGADNAELSETRNLLQYLGGKHRPKPYLSPKLNLPEESTLLFATCALWERVDDIEILDAYEESKPEVFLSSIQELFLYTQLINPAIRSYSLASVLVEKTFKEDTAKKKKRRRIIFLIAAIMLIAGIVAAIIISVIRISDRRLITEIENLDSEAVSYSQNGNYSWAYDKYETAVKKAETLNMHNWQFIGEKEALRRVIQQRLLLFASIQKGDSFMEDGKYEKALAEYESAIRLARSNEELMLTNMLESKLDRAETYIEVYMLIYFGEMYNTYGHYTKALEQFNDADANVKALGDLALLQQLMTLRFETNEKIVETIQESVIRQINESAENARSDAVKAESGAEAVIMLNKALKYYELILDLHEALNITGESYVSARSNVKSTENSIESMNKAEEYIKNAERDKNNAEQTEETSEQLEYYRSAKASLEEALKCYSEAGMKDTSTPYVEIRSEINNIENRIADGERPLGQTDPQTEETDGQELAK